MLELAVDNDVLIKTSRYQVAVELLHVTCSPGCENTWGVLATARFVCERSLRKAVDAGLAHPNSLVHFSTLIMELTLLEPDAAELALAARFEEYAQKENVPLDPGESILAAICILRECPILTGDKRAMEALQVASAVFPELAAMAERTFCLEQACVSLALALGPLVMRDALCADPSADRAVTMSFECGRGSVDPWWEPVGLKSYIDHLRTLAPDLLAPGCELRPI